MNSRKWEEQFLHEPTGCERPCVNFASGCCFAGSLQTGELSDLTLTLCEFYVPAEYERIKAAGWDWPKEAKPCLLCLRVEIYSRFIETRCNALSCVESINYATIGNIVGEPGEYTADTCFLSRPDRYEGVLHPVVVPTVFDYGILLVNGSRHLKQRLPYPGDANSSFFFLKSMRELGRRPADIPATVRVCHTTLKNSCDLEYVLLKLKSDCHRLPVAGYDTETVMCGT